jgi:hypothetical protein
VSVVALLGACRHALISIGVSVGTINGSIGV